MNPTVLNATIGEDENKIPNASSLVTTNVLNKKISEVESKIADHPRYITTPEFSKLASEHFKARLKKANSVIKTDFDKKSKKL